jgi:hypothetical protein
MGGPNDITRGEDSNFYIVKQGGAEKPAQVCVRDVKGTMRARIASRSFDDLIGAGEKQGRDRQTERFRGLEIDDQLQIRWLLDRQVGRFCAGFAKSPVERSHKRSNRAWAIQCRSRSPASLLLRAMRAPQLLSRPGEASARGG